jgi:hypothetical protein
MRNDPDPPATPEGAEDNGQASETPEDDDVA